MDTNQYIQDAKRTESQNFADVTNRLSDKGMQRLLHGGIGLATESGEFLDTLKKQIFYGKPLDKVNLAEELGDLFWYCAIIADELGVSFDQIMDTNIKKLKARYGDKFTEERADKRNLDKERAILEKNTI